MSSTTLSKTYPKSYFEASKSKSKIMSNTKAQLKTMQNDLLFCKWPITFSSSYVFINKESYYFCDFTKLFFYSNDSTESYARFLLSLLWMLRIFVILKAWVAPKYTISKTSITISLKAGSSW